MDRDGEEPPAAKKPRLGGGGAATNDGTIEEHIALGESKKKSPLREGRADEEKKSLPPSLRLIVSLCSFAQVSDVT